MDASEHDVQHLGLALACIGDTSQRRLLWTGRRATCLLYTIDNSHGMRTALLTGLVLLSGWLLLLLRAHGRRWQANLALRRRLEQPVVPPSRSISLIVPVKGDLPVSHLAAAERAMAGVAGELLLVMETESEPAWTRLQSWLAEHPESRWRGVLSGPCPQAENGKIHNLAAGIDASSGDVLLFADADVEMTAAMIHRAAALLEEPHVGAVFCPPYYEPSAHPGAGLLAAFTNYWFMPAMARGNLQGTLAYCAGACYGLQRSTYDQMRLFHTRRDLISEDAALGGWVVSQGMRVRLVPAVARMPADQVSLRVALDHLCRWMLLGRVIAPASFWRLPLAFEGWLVLLWLVGCRFVDPRILGVGLLLVLVGSWWWMRSMNRAFWGTAGPWQQWLWLLVFQLVMPFCWLDAARTRRMSWRGRRYQLDSQGAIVGVTDSVS